MKIGWRNMADFDDVEELESLHFIEPNLLVEALCPLPPKSEN